MPLIQVDLPQPLFDSHAAKMSHEIHQALIDSLDINPVDKFQVFRPRRDGELVFDPAYNNVDRQNLVLIQILIVPRYSTDLKRRLYERMVIKLEAIGIRREDILIAVSQNGFEDWFAGRIYGQS